MTEELFHWHRRDLRANDVAIVDTGSALFVWSGTKAADKRKLSACQMTQEYIVASNAKRDGAPSRSDSDVLLLHENAETLTFRALFHAWSSSVKGARRPCASSGACG